MATKVVSQAPSAFEKNGRQQTLSGHPNVKSVKMVQIQPVAREGEAGPVRAALVVADAAESGLSNGGIGRKRGLCSLRLQTAIRSLSAFGTGFPELFRRGSDVAIRWKQSRIEAQRPLEDGRPGRQRDGKHERRAPSISVHCSADGRLAYSPDGGARQSVWPGTAERRNGLIMHQPRTRRGSQLLASGSFFPVSGIRGRLCRAKERVALFRRGT